MLAADRVTTHALDRYREHHPEAEEGDLLAAITAIGTVSLDPALARTMCGRPTDHDRWKKDEDSYVLAADRCGIFVVVHGHTVITYLRFEQQQEDFAHKHWPLPSRKQRASALAATDIQVLLAVVRGPSGPDQATVKAFGRAQAEMMSRHLPLIDVPASKITFVHGAAKVFGNKLLAKAALFEASMSQMENGNIACTFPDGKRGVLYQRLPGCWTLSLTGA